jgi:3' terminal RNA ribose 2'-O-methyltransferase Hen1
LASLFKLKQLTRLVGMDVSMRSLDHAAERLNLDRLPPRQRARISLIHGSLIYRDKRLAGFDAATVIEVIEHLDAARLAAFERVLFEFARPASIVVTTPNREYNVRFANLPAGQSRHADHRFEWTRAEFRTWAEAQAQKFGYGVSYESIGEEDPELGPPTQAAVFELAIAAAPSQAA